MAINKNLVSSGVDLSGSAVVRHRLTRTSCQVVNLGKSTYTGNLQSLASVGGNERYSFEMLGASYRESIAHAACRSGHDRCWASRETFESGTRKAVEWFLSNPEWVASVKNGSSQQWPDKNYTARGLSA